MASDSMGIAYIVITINILGYFTVKRNRLGTLMYPCASVLPSTADHRGGCLSERRLQTLQSGITTGWCPPAYIMYSPSSAHLAGSAWAFWPWKPESPGKQVAASPLSPENSTVELVRCFNVTRPLLGWVMEEKANCSSHLLCWWEVKGLLQAC